MKAPFIVYDDLTVARQSGFAFDAWYANHYLMRPLQAGLAVGVRHYGSPARGAYLAVYEAEDRDRAQRLLRDLAATHPSVERTERFVGEQILELIAKGATPAAIESPICYPVFLRVPPARQREFDEWYDQEHVRMLLECEHWPMGRRFRIHCEAPGHWTHVALHYLSSFAAYESAARDAARSTPWRLRLESEDWFRPDNRVFHRHGAVAASSSRR